MGTASISRLALETILRISNASSDDETRAYLCGVHVFNRDSRLFIEATDGHIFARESIEDSHLKLESDLILSSEDVSKKLKSFLKSYPANKDFQIEITEFSLLIKIGSSAEVVSIGIIRREYPRVDSILPKKERPNEVTFSLNPELLISLYKALKSDKKDIGISLSVNLEDVSQPIKVSMANPTGEKTALIMPYKSDNNRVVVSPSFNNTKTKKELSA